MNENYLREELYHKIKTENQIFEFLQDAALDGIWYWDLEKPENEWMSPSFWKTLGFEPGEKQHRSSEWQSLIHPDDLEIATENLKMHLKDPAYPYDQVVRYKHKNGSTVWIRCRGMAIRNKHGEATRLLGAHIDITNLMHSQQKLNRLKNEFETVFNGTQDALFLIEVKGTKKFKFLRNNRTHQQATGITQAMIEGKSPYDLLGEDAGDTVANHYQDCVNQRRVVTYEETLELPSGKKIWHTTLSPIMDNQIVTHIVGSAIDITAQKMLEKELEKRANYDALTSLANRDYLMRKIAECVENYDQRFSFIFIDLDGFKDINDNYGHAIGDAVLKEMATRFLSVIQDDDFVARLGGDEFVILKKNIYQHTKINQFKDKLIKTIEQPLVIEDYTLSLSASVGYSRFPLNGLTYDQLSRYADTKMYENKRKNLGK